jgi:glycine/D-amino acid oxidase-like deaminating enzyme
VWVQTGDGRYDAEALIITAGAWAGRALAPLGLPLTVERKVLWWLGVADPAPYAPARFPIFITDSAHGEIYGFPVYQQPGLKIANHAGGDLTDPDYVDRTVQDDEKHDVVSLAEWFFEGVTSQVLHSAVCLYTRTPDSHFIIDRHPEWPQVIIGAGFSGHGFKFTPALGEYLVSLALSSDRQPHALFSLKRLAP